MPTIYIGNSATTEWLQQSSHFQLQHSDRNKVATFSYNIVTTTKLNIFLSVTQKFSIASVDLLPAEVSNKLRKKFTQIFTIPHALNCQISADTS